MYSNNSVDRYCIKLLVCAGEHQNRLGSPLLETAAQVSQLSDGADDETRLETSRPQFLGPGKWRLEQGWVWGEGGCMLSLSHIET